MGRGIYCCLLAVLLAWVYMVPAEAAHLPCGAPSYTPASDRAIFLWRDCTTGDWSLRAMGGGQYAAFLGELNATYPFHDFTPFALEADDVLQSPEPTRIQYSLHTWGSGVDGFDFSLPVGANATFGLTATDIPVLVGPDRGPLTPPFDLLDLAEDPTIQDGAPVYNPATEKDTFLWRTADGAWHLRVSGGGLLTNFTGHITANRAFTGVTPVNLEPGDILDTSNPARIDFDFTAVGWEDGVDFSFPADGSVCFTLESPDQAVHVGSKRVPIIGSFNPQTLTPCTEGTPSPDGAPVYDPAAQAALYLWRDGPGGGWHMRATAGGGTARYAGAIVSSVPFVNVTPVVVESNDVIDASISGRIDFNLLVTNAYQDGIDFQIPAGAQVCFTLNGSVPTVLMGVVMSPVTTPVDLATLGACAPVGAQMNLVVIMTDDQRFDSLSFMPNVTERLVAHGVNFTNAYVPQPLCCPARSSMFSGGYLPQNTGVLDNVLPNGGMTLFNDQENMGVVLQNAGYQSFYVGKWLNDYWRLGVYVPPGWNRFIGRQSDVTGPDWSNNKIYVIGSSDQNPSAGAKFTLSGQYITYYERDQVLDFLDHAQSGKPFFVFWSTAAPHVAATPAPGDENLFPGYVYRERSYGETDLSDKPLWLRNRTSPAIDDESVRDQLRSLQSVDRAVAAIVDKLTAMGQLDNTLIVFTSDNGFQWGEHHNLLWGKNLPYEESIRVPMVMVMPGAAPRTDDHLVSASLDLGPTLYELAGVPRQTDGTSLVPLLRDPGTPWRDELFFEGYSTLTAGHALWAAVRRNDWKYVKYWTGEEELYDLNSDPYEMESRHNDPAMSSLKATLAARTNQLLGLAIMPVKSFPTGKVNTSYSFQFKTWGGVAPFTWRLNSGQLPPGLALNAATGVVAGIPSAAGTYNFTMRVTDASFATQAQRARTFVSGPLNMIVNP